jgi:SOS-response transcriptional repressor LexA
MDSELTTAKERLKFFIRQKNMTIQDFCNRLDVSPTYVNNFRKGFGHDVEDKVTTLWPDLNLRWLMFGEGEMYVVSDRQKVGVEVPLLPVVARAGSLSEWSDGVTMAECERVVSPVRGVDFAIRINGDSMTPDYPSGSIAYIKKVNEASFIEWGSTYALDTHNGTVVKKLMPSISDDDAVRCVSINTDYPPFEIKKKEIIGFYKVVARIIIDA